MNSSFLSFKDLKDFSLWKELKNKRFPLSFALEITARCNIACRHCYINLPAHDIEARKNELTLEEIGLITDEAVSLGVLSCLITGGEPLLRSDFADIYILLKKKGLLVSVFTNATIITPEHIKLFKKYPPHDIEVTVYGVTKGTYEAVTQIPGSFSAFMKGLNLLIENGIKIRLKAVAIRSNVHELRQISDFCKARTKDYFRFDPLLHLRFDRNEKLNALICSERLPPEKIASIERADSERFEALSDHCDKFIFSGPSVQRNDHIFRCGIGRWSFAIGYDGLLRLCPSLWHPDCMYDLRQGSLKEAWDIFIPKALDRRSQRKEYHDTCCKCPVINLCLWCPAHAYLETGELDVPVAGFCEVAHARAASLRKSKSDEKPALT
jgi:radical SAM protein with 4Fe4S-binding SPASM domain